VIGEEQKLIFYEIAVGSAMLVWINILFIYFSAVLVFKIKQVDKFQLIRKIDEGAWTNLPRVQRSPTSRAGAARSFVDRRGRICRASSARPRVERALRARSWTAPTARAASPAVLVCWGTHEKTTSIPRLLLAVAWITTRPSTRFPHCVGGSDQPAGTRFLMMT
jgi:hypothetical protein